MENKTIASLLVALPLAATAQTEQIQRPNLVIVMADQWRGDALGFLKKEAVKTPNLDKFATSALVLNQAVSGYPVSSPARAMLMTGAYPHKNMVPVNCNSITSAYNVELPADMVCWSDVLKGEGYMMGYIGKWHLDKLHEPYIETANNTGEIKWNEWCPPERRHGFDYWVAYGTYDRHLRPMYWNNTADRDNWTYVDRWGPEYEADLAVGFIARNAKRPFAMMVSMNPPHTGYELVPDRYKEIYKDLNVDSIVNSRPNIGNEKFFRQSIRDYYACMSGVDEQFGRIVDELKRQGIFDNTIVVFTSDHGDMMGIHNHIGKNVIYEESVRIPMLISYPDKIKTRMDNELLFSLEDLYPTLLPMMGITDKTPTTVQSRNLSGQILGISKEKEGSQLYFLWGEGDKPINASTGTRGLRNLRYSFTITWLDGKIVDTKLFDRQCDPFQMKNIAESNKKIVKNMTKELYERLRTIEDPITKLITKQ